MPKAKDTEYRDRTATAERTEYQDRVLRRVLPAVEAQGCLLVDAAQLVGELHHCSGSGRPATAGVVSRAHTLELLRITQGPG